MNFFGARDFLKRFWKIFPFETDVIIFYPIAAPPDPWEPWFEQTWMNIISESFPVNMSSSGSMVLQKIFKWSHPIFAFMWLSPLGKEPGPSFEQFLILNSFHDLHQVWLKLACWFWKRGFFQYEYGFCYCGSSRPLRTMISTNLNLHYIRKLSCDMSSSSSVVLEKKISKLPHPIIAVLWLSPLWKEPGP
jgi:hypothetical protein